VQATLGAESKFPEKRIVAHFMQPHYPFLGKKGKSLPNHATFTGDGIRVADTEAPTIWELLRNGSVDTNEVWEAYEENLHLVLPPVKNLIDSLRGKSVVTADHGNAFGEFGFPIPLRTYGHPQGLRYKSLIKIPWLVYEGDERKAVKSGSIREDSDTSSNLEERLSHLGYR
jgi:hypothetical protein